MATTLSIAAGQKANFFAVRTLSWSVCWELDKNPATSVFLLTSPHRLEWPGGRFWPGFDDLRLGTNRGGHGTTGLKKKNHEMWDVYKNICVSSIDSLLSGIILYSTCTALYEAWPTSLTGSTQQTGNLSVGPLLMDFAHFFTPQQKFVTFGCKRGQKSSFQYSVAHFSCLNWETVFATNEN